MARSRRPARERVRRAVRKLRYLVLGAPPFPHRPDGRLLLHLGCGAVDAPGFVNVDLRPAFHVHVVAPLDRLPMFRDGTADLVYACHVLEHFSHARVPRVLAEWTRLLRPGGTLRVAVPDFAAVARAYGAGVALASLQGFLMGEQDYPLNAHAAVFDEPLLSGLLAGAGLSEIRRWDPESAPDHAFRDTSALRIEIGGGGVPASLNLEGRRAPA